MVIKRLLGFYVIKKQIQFFLNFILNIECIKIGSRLNK